MRTISRVHQTEFGYGNGNCWQACIACMLKVKLEDVPHFIKNMDTWWEDTQEWMVDRGYYLIDLGTEAEGKVDQFLSTIPDGVHCILSGKSPRGDFNHSVIGRSNGKRIDCIFDPHPDGTFLDGKIKWITFIGTLGD